MRSRPSMCCLLSAAKEMVKVLPRCRKICRDRERPCRSCRAVGCSTPLQPARNGAPGFILMSPDKNCKNLPERISARKNPAGPLWKTGRVAQDLPTWGQKCAAWSPSGTGAMTAAAVGGVDRPAKSASSRISAACLPMVFWAQQLPGTRTLCVQSPGTSLAYLPVGRKST